MSSPSSPPSSCSSPPQSFDVLSWCSSSSSSSVPSTSPTASRRTSAHGPAAAGLAMGLLASALARGETAFLRYSGEEMRSRAHGLLLIVHETLAGWPRAAGAVTLGIVAAIVLTALNSVVDPVMSHMASKRCGLIAALRRNSLKHMRVYFWMILPTNLVKYPAFELTLAVLESVPLPHFLLTTSHWRGMLSGIIFCTAMLPVANTILAPNIRKATVPRMYRGYLPTVLRDVVYGMVREAAQERFTESWWPGDMTWKSQAIRLGAATSLACLFSSPFDELRRWLRRSKGIPLQHFIALTAPSFLRTTTVGAIVMGVALAVGKCASPSVERWAEGVTLYAPGTVLTVLIGCLVALVAFIHHRRSERRRAAPKKQSSVYIAPSTRHGVLPFNT